MKRALFILLFLIGSVSHANNIIRIGCYDNPPLMLVNNQDEPTGFYIDLTNAIANRIGWNVVFIKTSFPDGLEMLDNGSIDILAGLASSPEREEIYDFNSESVITNWGQLFANKNVNLTSLLDIDGKTVGLLKDDIHAIRFLELINGFNLKITIEYFDRYDAINEALQHQQLDFGVFNRMYGLRNKHVTEIKPTTIVFNPINLHFAVKAGSKLDFTDFDFYLKQFKENVNSPYHITFEKWFEPSKGVKNVKALFYALLVFIGILLLSGLYIIILHAQVNSRTRVISEHNRNLQSTLNELEASELRFKTLAENIPGVVYMANATDRFDLRYINEASKDLLEYDSNELKQIGYMYKSLINPDDLIVLEDVIKAAFVNGNSFQVTYRLKERNGKWLWMEEFGKFVCTNDGKANGFIEGIVLDKTKQHFNERFNEFIYKLAELSQADVTMNEFYAKIHYSLQQVIPAQNMFVAILDDDKNTFRFEYFQDQFDDNPVELSADKPTMTSYVFKTGKSLLGSPDVLKSLPGIENVKLIGTRSAVWLGVPLKSKGETFGVLVIQHYDDPNAYNENDLRLMEIISNRLSLTIEKRKYQEEIEFSREFLFSIFSSMGDALITLDLDMKITSCNQKAEEMFEYSTEELENKSFIDLLSREHSETIGLIDLILNEIENSKLYQTDELLFLQSSGKNFPARLIVSPFRNDEEKVIGLVCTIHDNSKHQKLEEQLMQAQKMEAIGRLAGGIAHDFNNILTVIMGNNELAKVSLDQSHPAQLELSEIATAAERAAKLTDQLLSFSRKQTLIPKVVDCNDILLGMKSMLHRLIDEDIELNIYCANSLWQIKIDPHKLEQVVMNLVINAKDAMLNGGQIVLETNNVVLDEEYVANHADAIPGDFVVISITDTGTGIEKDRLSLIFEPFYTTKAIGKGTGLGLSMVYGIVKQSGGFIYVYSEVGIGTTFKIYFPKHSTIDKTDSNIMPIVERFYVGKEHILVVEDEESLRKLTIRILQIHGYQVQGAASGEEALELLNPSLDNKFDLILSDVVMPKVGGVALLKELHHRGIATKFIFMSGYSDKIFEISELKITDYPFIQKPFKSSEILELVRKVLDSKG